MICLWSIYKLTCKVTASNLHLNAVWNSNREDGILLAAGLGLTQVNSSLKNSKHPCLAQLSKLAEDGGCLPFLTHVPRDGWRFGRVALPNGKVREK